MLAFILIFYCWLMSATCLLYCEEGSFGVGKEENTTYTRFYCVKAQYTLIKLLLDNNLGKVLGMDVEKDKKNHKAL